jgi:multidrug efflux pump
MLTAAAAILGMIPIASDSFWRPMAMAIMGGVAVATLLTLLFLPAAYVAWFRIREPVGASGPDGKAVIDEGGRHGSSLSAGHAQGA